MLKQGFFTALLALLFAATPALADDHKKDSHEGAKHPAHEMGDAADSASEKKDELSEEAKDNLEAAEESANPPHPAHEMGEGEELQERGQ